MKEENEKKYTVYEIEKLTKGKLSKYKLTKAIEGGLLKAEKVKRTKKGRGVPNYFVYETDLYEYLKYIEENKKKFIAVPEDDIEKQSEEASASKDQIVYLLETNKSQLDQHSEALDKLQKQFSMLIEQQSMALKDEEERSQARKELLSELTNMPSFEVKRREEILDNLLKLS